MIRQTFQRTAIFQGEIDRHYIVTCVRYMLPKKAEKSVTQTKIHFLSRQQNKRKTKHADHSNNARTH